MATIPASAAAATVTPVGAGVLLATGTESIGAGSVEADMPTDWTSDHECQCALDETVAAMAAGASASSNPAAIAAALRRSRATGNHTRRFRVRPRPVSM